MTYLKRLVDYSDSELEGLKETFPLGIKYSLNSLLESQSDWNCQRVVALKRRNDEGMSEGDGEASKVVPTAEEPDPSEPLTLISNLKSVAILRVFFYFRIFDSKSEGCRGRFRPR